MILDTCRGEEGSTVVARTATAGLLGGKEGTAFSWGLEPLTVAGGEYRLCWCAGAPFSCVSLSDFKVDVGQLTVIGPRYPADDFDQGDRQLSSTFDQDRICEAV